ncbi:MAG: glycerate kinase [Clostridia bacterium]|nr:glycerate kinase [Clostridia bacterium]
MKIILAPDSYKDCLSAIDVCHAMEAGIRRVAPSSEVVYLPIADGGEGTLEALSCAAGISLITESTCDPLGRTITASFGLDGETAIVELAQASGLQLLSKEERNPEKTSTYGTGLQIKSAIEKGAKTVYITLGGSATTDGGMGLLRALGAKFYDAAGDELLGCGADLIRVSSMDLSALPTNIAFSLVCDVKNPLFGPDGAAYIYGPQKGADSKMVERLDDGLRNLHRTCKANGLEIDGIAAGAAGGVGALQGFLSATVVSGIDWVLEQCHFYEYLKDASLVLTGEGKTDSQTLNGKAMYGIAVAAKTQNVPVIGISGSLGNDLEGLYACGVTALFSICNHPMPLSEALEHAASLITAQTENVLRCFSV